jgi:hypothetical protein
MSRAKAGIEAATRAGAADADPVDLDFARGKYTQAQAAMQAKKYSLASNLADESMADSNLAVTKARLASMRSRIKSQTLENARLRKQLLDHAPAAASSTSPPTDSGTRELPQTVLPAPSMPSSAPAPATSAPAAATSTSPVSQESHS